MVGILGRMAAESGQEITWDQAMASNVELAPGLDKLTMDSPAPVMPDAQGRYPIAMPGMTKALLVVIPQRRFRARAARPAGRGAR